MPRKLLGNRRVTGLEQCYTPPEVAHRVIDVVEQHVPTWRDRGWVEPCGGTGVFLEALADRGVSDVHAVDVRPLHPRVRKGDFLSAVLPAGKGKITATNPPFGRNNALSIPFFNRAAEISDYIAFIVPRSWRKWSVINRLHPSFHVVVDEDLQIDYLDAMGQRLYLRNNLRTCIQLWERRQAARERCGAEDRGYIQKCGPKDADVALTIFGRGCGTVRNAFPREPNTTQLYLRVRDAGVLHALQQVDYSRFFDNVAYTEALSIKEIWFLLNEFFDERRAAT
jgi:predicted RNA methylase